MKLVLVLPIYFCLLFPTRLQASKTYNYTYVCESFTSGKIDAIKTLKALNQNINNYSIGVNNTAKILCT